MDFELVACPRPRVPVHWLGRNKIKDECTSNLMDLSINPEGCTQSSRGAPLERASVTSGQRAPQAGGRRRACPACGSAERGNDAKKCTGARGSLPGVSAKRGRRDHCPLVRTLDLQAAAARHLARSSVESEGLAHRQMLMMTPIIPRAHSKSSIQNSQKSDPKRRQRASGPQADN